MTSTLGDDGERLLIYIEILVFFKWTFTPVASWAVWPTPRQYRNQLASEASYFRVLRRLKKNVRVDCFGGGPGREEFETTSLSTAALSLLCISFDEQVKCLEMESAV